MLTNTSLQNARLNCQKWATAAYFKPYILRDLTFNWECFGDEAEEGVTNEVDFVAYAFRSRGTCWLTGADIELALIAEGVFVEYALLWLRTAMEDPASGLSVRQPMALVA